MTQLNNIILKPLITEKMSVATEKLNRYGFQVALNANKNQIKLAVEKLYDVKVEAIETNIRPGKVKRAGKSLTRTTKTKHAFVTLKEGQTIELFKGV